MEIKRLYNGLGTLCLFIFRLKLPRPRNGHGNLKGSLRCIGIQTT